MDSELIEIRAQQKRKKKKKNQDNDEKQKEKSFKLRSRISVVLCVSHQPAPQDLRPGYKFFSAF